MNTDHGRHHLKVNRLLIASVFLLASVPMSVHPQEPSSELSGFESAEIRQVTDGRTLAANDEVLQRLFYRVGRVSETSLARFAIQTRGVGAVDIGKAPSEYRFQVFEIAGRAKKVLPVLLSDLADGSAGQEFFLIQVDTGDGDLIAVAVPVSPEKPQTPSIPARWPQRKSIDQPIRFQGFFMARCKLDSAGTEQNVIDVSAAGEAETLVFVAPRLEWFPDANSEEVPLDESRLLLARNGVDIGRLDSIRSQGGSLGERDAASFYQILAATNRISAADLPAASINFRDALRQPQANTSQAIAVSGHVRRATRIDVTNDRAADRLGIDHYWQLDMFVPLDLNERIVIKPAAEAGHSEQIELDNRFPVAICVTELPCGEEEILRRQIAVRGFFFKLWDYESERTQQAGPGVRQISPLVIGLKPLLIGEPTDGLGTVIGVGASVFLIGLLALILGFRRSNKVT